MSTRYPDDPNELPEDVYHHAYDIEDPPCVCHLERLTNIVLHHVPLRKNSKLLVNEQAKARAGLPVGPVIHAVSPSGSASHGEEETLQFRSRALLASLQPRPREQPKPAVLAIADSDKVVSQVTVPDPQHVDIVLPPAPAAVPLLAPAIASLPAPPIATLAAPPVAPLPAPQVDPLHAPAAAPLSDIAESAKDPDSVGLPAVVLRDPDSHPEASSSDGPAGAPTLTEFEKRMQAMSVLS